MLLKNDVKLKMYVVQGRKQTFIQKSFKSLQMYLSKSIKFQLSTDQYGHSVSYSVKNTNFKSTSADSSSSRRNEACVSSE